MHACVGNNGESKAIADQVEGRSHAQCLGWPLHAKQESTSAYQYFNNQQYTEQPMSFESYTRQSLHGQSMSDHSFNDQPVNGQGQCTDQSMMNLLEQSPPPNVEEQHVGQAQGVVDCQHGSPTEKQVVVQDGTNQHVDASYISKKVSQVQTPQSSSDDLTYSPPPTPTKPFLMHPDFFQSSPSPPLIPGRARVLSSRPLTAVKQSGVGVMPPLSPHIQQLSDSYAFSHFNFQGAPSPPATHMKSYVRGTGTGPWHAWSAQLNSHENSNSTPAQFQESNLVTSSNGSPHKKKFPRKSLTVHESYSTVQEIASNLASTKSNYQPEVETEPTVITTSTDPVSGDSPLANVSYMAISSGPSCPPSGLPNPMSTYGSRNNGSEAEMSYIKSAKKQMDIMLKYYVELKKKDEEDRKKAGSERKETQDRIAQLEALVTRLAAQYTTDMQNVQSEHKQALQKYVERVETLEQKVRQLTQHGPEEVHTPVVASVHTLINLTNEGNYKPNDQSFNNQQYIEQQMGAHSYTRQSLHEQPMSGQSFNDQSVSGQGKCNEQSMMNLLEHSPPNVEEQHVGQEQGVVDCQHGSPTENQVLEQDGTKQHADGSYNSKKVYQVQAPQSSSDDFTYPSPSTPTKPFLMHPDIFQSSPSPPLSPRIQPLSDLYAFSHFNFQDAQSPPATHMKSYVRGTGTGPRYAWSAQLNSNENSTSTPDQFQESTLVSSSNGSPRPPPSPRSNHKKKSPLKSLTVHESVQEIASNLASTESNCQPAVGTEPTVLTSTDPLPGDSPVSYLAISSGSSCPPSGLHIAGNPMSTYRSQNNNGPRLRSVRGKLKRRPSLNDPEHQSDEEANVSEMDRVYTPNEFKLLLKFKKKESNARKLSAALPALTAHRIQVPKKKTFRTGWCAKLFFAFTVTLSSILYASHVICPPLAASSDPFTGIIASAVNVDCFCVEYMETIAPFIENPMETKKWKTIFTRWLPNISLWTQHADTTLGFPLLQDYCVLTVLYTQVQIRWKAMVETLVTGIHDTVSGMQKVLSTLTKSVENVEIDFVLEKKNEALKKIGKNEEEETTIESSLDVVLFGEEPVVDGHPNEGGVAYVDDVVTDVTDGKRVLTLVGVIQFSLMYLPVMFVAIFLNIMF